MEEIICDELKQLIAGELSSEIIFDWLKGKKDDPKISCTRTQFVVSFLNYIRSQTKSLLQHGHTSSAVLELQTPQKTHVQENDFELSNVESVLSPIPSVADENSIRSSNSIRSTDKPSQDGIFASTPHRKSLFQDSNQTFSSPERNTSQSQSIINDISKFSINDSTKSDSFSLKSHNQSYFKKSWSKMANYEGHNNSLSKRSPITLSSFLPDEFNNSASSNNSSKDFSNKSKHHIKKINIDDTFSFPPIGATRRIKPTTLNTTSTSTVSEPPCFGIKIDKQEQHEAFKVQNFQPREEALGFEKERDILKKEKDKLLEKFQTYCNNISNFNATKVSQLTPKKAPSITILKKPEATFEIPNPAEIHDIEILNTLATLYSLIIDLNLVSSIFSELYFIISLIDVQKSSDNEDCKLDSTCVVNYLLSDIHNCIYFALATLEGQKNFLEFLLDKNDMRHLYENERIVHFLPRLADYFAYVSSYKASEKVVLVHKSEIVYKNVCFMTEMDSKDNFPNANSFKSFKMQRDLFYDAFSYWERKNATSTINTTGFSEKVRKIITLSCNSTNMARLARLFREQLIATCILIHKDETDQFLVQLQSEIGSNSISQKKLAMLTNRFTAPPTSTDVDKKCPFSMKEDFFRSFILHSDSLAFQQHLIDSLIDEIYRLNDEFSFSSIENEYKEPVEVELKLQYMGCVKSLCVLSKFLGYLFALPYIQVYSPNDHSSYKSTKTTSRTDIKTVSNNNIANDEISVRNQTQPPIDLVNILYKSSKVGKLILSVPWIVQLLTLLDHGTLKLPYYDNLLRCLFTVCLNSNNTSYGTKILLRLIVGYLFDVIEFPQDYYYSSLMNNRIEIVDCIDEKPHYRLDSLNILDTSVLMEICPFLKELKLIFSMCIGHKKQTLQRNPRHITPVTSNVDYVNFKQKKEMQLQVQLEEWFLRSYPSSVALSIQIVSERVGSIIMKLAKVQIPIFQEKLQNVLNHKIASAITNNINTQEIKTIALRTCEELVKTFKNKLQEASCVMAKNRCKLCLEGLLPLGVPLAAQEKLISICARKARQPLFNWLNTQSSLYFTELLSSNSLNIDTIINRVSNNPASFICVNIDEDYSYVFGESAAPSSPCPNNAVLQNDNRCFDDVFVSSTNVISGLKEKIIECLSREIGKIFDESLKLLLNDATKCCQSETTPAYCKKIISQLTIDLAILIVALHPSLLDYYLEPMKIIWTEFKNINVLDMSIAKENKHANEITRFSDLVFGKVKNMDQEKKPATNKIDTNENEHDTVEESVSNDYFCTILCPRNILLLTELGRDNKNTWNTLTKFIVFLLKNEFVNEDSVTDQCLALYRQDWPQDSLEGLAECMREVTKSYSAKSEKFTLFLDFLSEFCVNLHADFDFDS